MTIHIPLSLFIVYAVLGVIGLISLSVIVFIIILKIIDNVLFRKDMKQYREDLKNSGFYEEMTHKIDKDEKKSLDETGKGGKTVIFNTKTRKVTVKDEQGNIVSEGK